MLFSYFKKYLSTRRIFFIDRLKAVSAMHFDASTAILSQTVQN